MWLTRFALNRPVIVALATVGLAVFGLISYFMLGRNLFPNVQFPEVSVSAYYPGASPQEMERLVVKPIEDQLDGMDNLEKMQAVAQEGRAAVFIQFHLDTNLDTAANQVQQRVETARAFMPSDLDPPQVERQSNSSEPILTEALSSSTMSGTALGDLVTNRIESQIKAIPNVQSLDVFGEPGREFHVMPDRLRMQAANATLSDVFSTLSRNNQNQPGGRIDSPISETSVSVHADVNSAQDIAALPLSVAGGGAGAVPSALRVGDVARVEDGHVEQRRISHYNGAPTVYVDIHRQATADTVKSTTSVRAGLKALAAQYPQIRFKEIEASADYTQASINGVLQSLLEGIILTAIVMLLFLHAWRNAIVVMVAIPVSLLTTFIVMRALNFTVDIISMMGLGLTIGILVDDSIVVLENITRHRDLGLSPDEAAITGRTEIGNAAIAITLVDVIVFTPIAFMSGIVGKFMKEFGIVIVVATLCSLVVSFTLTPLLAGKWSVKRRSTAPPKYLAWFQRGFEAVQVWYSERALPTALRHGAFVGFTCFLLVISSLMLPAGPSLAVKLNLFIAVVIVAGIVGLFLFQRLRARRRRVPVNGAAPLFGGRLRWMLITLAVPLALAAIFSILPRVGGEFIPNTPVGVVRITVDYPQGQPLAVTQRAVNRLEHEILKIKDVESVLSSSGSKPSGYGQQIGGNVARLTIITFKDKRKEQDRIAAEIRKLTWTVPGGKLSAAGESGGSGASSPIYYTLTGPDATLDQGAKKLAGFIRTIPGTVDVLTSLEDAAPRLNIQIDPVRAALLGVSPGDAATAARIALGGAVATRVRTDTGLVDVRLQLPFGQRNDLDSVRQIPVRSSSGSLVNLSDVATFTLTKAPAKIERQNRHRVVSVTGQIDPKSHLTVGDVNSRINGALSQPGFLPPGVALSTEGDTQLQNETQTAMMLAMMTSGVLVYMLMVILYGSFLEPFIIMFSIPVAIVGALVGLSIHHQTLNLFSLIGIVMLFGLVAKNGILLVDYTNTLHYKRGLAVTEALLTAAKIRFRPIIMTTCAMIFGMLPLSLGLTEGARSRASMGTVLIGGLISSLILTLFLVPMVYNTWIGGLERWKSARAERRARAAELEPAGALS